MGQLRVYRPNIHGGYHADEKARDDSRKEARLRSRITARVICASCPRAKSGWTWKNGRCSTCCARREYVRAQGGIDSLSLFGYDTAQSPLSRRIRWLAKPCSSATTAARKSKKARARRCA